MNLNIDRECLSKTRYASQDEVDREIRTLFNEGHGELRSYPCIFCRGIHLTSRVTANE